jgi:hypothetical protein
MGGRERRNLPPISCAFSELLNHLRLDPKTPRQAHPIMSVIESRWRKRQSRSEDGIYFATDEFIELCGNPKKGYRADIRASIATLLQSSPDGWTELEEACCAEAGDFLTIAGSTSWEGCGFIAVEERTSGRLVWLLHLSETEPFTEVSSNGAIIRAVSEEYPARFEWRIPIEAPDSLVVTSARHA